MPNLPLPFVVGFLLLVLAARLTGTARRLAVYLVGCAALSILVGLRWGIDPGWVRIGLPMMGAATTKPWAARSAASQPRFLALPP